MGDPYAKVEWVKFRHGRHLTELAKEAGQIMNSRANLDKKAFALIDVIDRFMYLWKEQAPCHAKCSHCCYQSVVIFDWEADRIQKHSGTKRAEFTGFGFDNWELGRQKSYVEQYNGKPCPFLKDDLCSIYEVRPFSCRTHLSLGDDPALCDILNNPGMKVPYVDMTGQRNMWAQLMIFSGRKVGDIREFFDGR